MYADLHTHTNYSDGFADIEELIELAKEAGIKTIAVTDHDTYFHMDKVKEACDKHGLTHIRGVEMSCYDFDVNKRIHIVALNLNEHAPHVEAYCNNVLKHRDLYHQKMIKDLNELGYEITYEDAKETAQNNVIFKMDIFLAIVRKYGDKIDQRAFYMEHFAVPSNIEVDRHMGYTDIKDAIDAIHKDGGVAILAHPNAYDNFPEAEKYIAMGLDGLEINHPSMETEHTEHALNLIEKYDLIRSGGSDFHGGREVSAMSPPIGQNGLTEEQYKLTEERIFKNAQKNTKL